MKLLRLAIVLAVLLTTAATPAVAQTPAATCQLGSPKGTIQHVIYLQFDNVHFARDNPNVPSDLEQMPHLLNFITQNGALLTQQHTPLIAHTGGDIATVETGLYPDRQGLAVSNTYRYFTPAGPSRTGVAFTYWTSPVFDPGTTTPTDTSFNMLGPDGKNVPAPWVPFTRAGCNVGAAGVANAVLENTATDVTTVFGSGSPEAQEVASNADQAFADFVGVAVHCAQGSSVCASGRPDQLPNESGGYDGFQGLFGHKAVAPVISPGGPLADLNGRTIQDPGGRQGFPGFDGLTPAVTLSYIAAMQEHGMPVTFGYLSDAHDPHFAPQGTPTYGPGQAEYEAALMDYDTGFDAFFSRLAKDGITASNTLLVVTADEGDHFVGGPPSPPDCDGVNVACTYPQIGQIGLNLTGLLSTQAGVNTPFSVHADSAPAIYLDGQPGREDDSVTGFARALASLRVDNPYSGASEGIVGSLAGEAEQRVLHMVTGDPLRTPTLVLFGDPNYYGATGSPDCEKPCVAINPTAAWDHGDVGPDINTTWLGVAGPGVQRAGVDSSIWSDHADVRPTLLALTGLRDTYSSDGRVLFEVLSDAMLPSAVVDQRALLTGLAQDYKRINAPVADLGLSTLAASSLALQAADTTQLAQTDAALDDLATRRADLATRIRAVLEGAAFNGQRADATRVASLQSEAHALLDDAAALPH
ncbi:MAG: hypothetical protein JO020_01495 [Chloroflexi bacterium]|nr:hypothetical protein [Chloroflexota bacterium]